MKKFSWWNKPITWGNYAAYCMISVVCTTAWVIYWFTDWFENAAEFLKKRFYKEPIKDDNGEKQEDISIILPRRMRL